MYHVRRFGHNEIDEPMFTQPIMYSIIKKHPNVMDIYSKKLISEGVVTKEEFGATVDKYERICEDAYKKAGEETQVGQNKTQRCLNVHIFLNRHSTNTGWTPPGLDSSRERIQ